MPSKSVTASENAPKLFLYEYSVVRFVPSIEREEFVNIGLVMMCKRSRWIKVAFNIDSPRIKAFHTECDHDCLTKQTASFINIADGRSDGGPIAALEPHERFRWLTAVRSASIQTSRPHPGKTDNLDSKFNELFSKLVL